MSAEASRSNVIKYKAISSNEPDPIIVEMDIDYSYGGYGEMTSYVKDVCNLVKDEFQNDSEKPKPKM